MNPIKIRNFFIAVFDINYWGDKTALLLPFPAERCKRNKLFPFWNHLSITTLSIEIIAKNQWFYVKDYFCSNGRRTENAFNKKRRHLHSKDCCQQIRFFACGKSDQSQGVKHSYFSYFFLFFSLNSYFSYFFLFFSLNSYFSYFFQPKFLFFPIYNLNSYFFQILRLSLGMGMQVRSASGACPLCT